jgi:hypothetical protein
MISKTKKVITIKLENLLLLKTLFFTVKLNTNQYYGGLFVFSLLQLAPLSRDLFKSRKENNHNMSSSCGTCTKEIWAAFFRQIIWAGLEWFLAASPTATVQVNTEKVKSYILSLIFFLEESISKKWKLQDLGISNYNKIFKKE